MYSKSRPSRLRCHAGRVNPGRTDAKSLGDRLRCLRRDKRRVETGAQITGSVQNRE